MKNSDGEASYNDILNILTAVDLLSKTGSNAKGFTFSMELMGLVTKAKPNNIDYRAG